MAFKRRRSVSRPRRAKKTKTSYKKRRLNFRSMSRIGAQVSRLSRMIETKEGRRTNVTNQNCAHNNTTVLSDDPLQTDQGIGDPMSGSGNRIGDQIYVRGLSAKFFLEGALGRTKVYFRVMLLKGAKGETFDRSTIFKGNSGNKMLDEINTERFTVIAQKIITVQPPNRSAVAVQPLTGAPTIDSVSAVTGNRILKFWIPGVKFGRKGRLQYENGGQQTKFFSHRWVIVAYDWYGTPQDTNNVGIINECYSKLYYKDA